MDQRRRTSEAQKPILCLGLCSFFFCSNCSDTDFTVKITDVYPVLRGEASVLLGDSIMRMRWRNGVHLPPQNMTIGKVRCDQLKKQAMWAECYLITSPVSHKL